MIKDAQVKGLFMSMSEGKPLYKSAQKAAMCENTARKYYRKQKFPIEIKPEHNWRTRPDPFSEVWNQVEKILSDNPRLEAKTAFAWLQREYPGRFEDGQLRTLQRRMRRCVAATGLNMFHFGRFENVLTECYNNGSIHWSFIR